MSIVKDMSIEDYHNHHAISKSGLDLIAKCPLNYWDQRLSPDKPEREGKSHFTIGQAFHTLILEPDTFNDRFIVWSGAPRNTKAGKNEYEQALENANGRDLLKKSEFADIQAMARSVRSHPGAMRLLKIKGIAEGSIFWKDQETGVDCRIRPDFLRDDGLIVDIKSAVDASPEGFKKAAFNHRYDVQSSFYSEGVKQAGINPLGFAFIVVEKTRPWCVGAYSADQDFAMLGEYRMRKDMETYAACLKRNEWPSYSNMIQPLGLPPWGHKILNEGVNNE